jgi:hypothetical protein
MWKALLFGALIGLIILLLIRLSEITVRMKTFESFILTAVTQNELYHAVANFGKNDTYSPSKQENDQNH